MSFRDVLSAYGHRRIVELLARSISRDSLPPSLIFAGPEAAGERPAAIAVAQALNCLDPVRQATEPTTGALLALDACGACAQCVRIARAVHPDVTIVEASDSVAIKIDQVRAVIERSGYRPFEGRRRVFVVDGAEAMAPAAQSALLKTLEEPPASSVFVLITPRPDMLLPTVRSRCIQLLFTRTAREDIDVDAREIARRVLAHAATGSAVRRLEGARELLTKTGATAASDREQVAAHLTAMASLLRDIEAIAAPVDDSLLTNADIRPALERLVPAYQRDRGVAAFSAIDRALDAIDRNVGIKVVADWLVLQL